MSEFVYVIEELDTDEFETTPINNVNNANNVSPMVYKILLGNNTTLASIPRLGLPNSPAVSSAPFKKIDRNAQNECITLARMKVDLNQFKETSNSTNSEKVKMWPQYRWHCFLCAHNTDYYKLLINHLKDCHYIKTDDDIRYLCSDCGRVIDEYCQFLNHLRQNHYPHLRISCDVCSLMYDRHEKLAKHRETHAEQTDLRPRVYNCNRCELCFANKSEIDYHSAHHNSFTDSYLIPKKTWSCNKCGRKYDTSNALAKHTSFSCLRRSLAYRISTKKNNQAVK